MLLAKTEQIADSFLFFPPLFLFPALTPDVSRAVGFTQTAASCHPSQ